MTGQNTFTFDIVEHVGTLSTYHKSGEEWSKEVNIVAWNGNSPKADIRDWNADHTRMSKGIVLKFDEAERLVTSLHSWLQKRGA